MIKIILIGALLSLGFIMPWVFLFLLNIAGLPGVLISFKSKPRSLLFYTGLIISITFQSYVYLSYQLVVITFVKQNIIEGEIINYFIWLLAVYACYYPIRKNELDALKEARLDNLPINSNLLALKTTVIISMFSFLVFAFSSITVRDFWFWL